MSSLCPAFSACCRRSPHVVSNSKEYSFMFSIASPITSAKSCPPICSSALLIKKSMVLLTCPSDSASSFAISFKTSSYTLLPSSFLRPLNIPLRPSSESISSTLSLNFLNIDSESTSEFESIDSMSLDFSEFRDCLLLEIESHEARSVILAMINIREMVFMA